MSSFNWFVFDDTEKICVERIYDSLSNLGLFYSYEEKLRIISSIIQDPTNHTFSPNSYIQLICDNADYNTYTIDDKNTLILYFLAISEMLVTHLASL